jgi:hypothetical protein
MISEPAHMGARTTSLQAGLRKTVCQWKLSCLSTTGN